MRSTVLSDIVLYDVHSAVRQRVMHEVHSAVRQSDV